MAAGVGRRPASGLVRRAMLVGFMALATVSFAGCEYLLGLSGAVPAPLDPGASFDPDAPFGPPEATYRTGKATVTIGDQVVTLDRLVGTGTLQKTYGAEVVWTGDEGWYLRVGSMLPKGTAGDFGAYLSVDRVADGRHLSTYDSAGCQVNVVRADTTGVEGTASCKNLNWFDAIGGSMAGGPPPSEGPSFAAEITFEAAP